MFRVIILDQVPEVHGTLDHMNKTNENNLLSLSSFITYSFEGTCRNPQKIVFS